MKLAAVSIGRPATAAGGCRLHERYVMDRPPRRPRFGAISPFSSIVLADVLADDGGIGNLIGMTR